MTLLERIAGALDEEESREPRRYQCLGCGETFRSPDRREDASCPDCGVSRVRVAE